MLFAKKQFVRFKYARELFSFLELECDWHFFRRLVRLGKVFFCTESTIWNPSAAHRFKEKNSSTLPKNWSICIPPLNSLQNMLLQAEIDIIFNSQIIRHICGWIYKDFCRHLLIRDWCRTEIVLKVKDWIWLWLTSRNGDLRLFFLNWNKLQKGTIVGDYGTQEWFWF